MGGIVFQSTYRTLAPEFILSCVLCDNFSAHSDYLEGLPMSKQLSDFLQDATSNQKVNQDFYLAALDVAISHLINRGPSINPR